VQPAVGGDLLAVHEGAVGAAEVADGPGLAGLEDGGVPGAGVEVLVGMELEVGLGMAADTDVRLVELLETPFGRRR